MSQPTRKGRNGLLPIDDDGATFHKSVSQELVVYRKRIRRMFENIEDACVCYCWTADDPGFGKSDLSRVKKTSVFLRKAKVRMMDDDKMNTSRRIVCETSIELMEARGR